MSIENNNTEIKEQDARDEIIWELKHKKTFAFFWSWIARIGYLIVGISFIVIALEKFLNKNNNGWLISAILAILIILWFLQSPLMLYKTLNLKKMFIKNDNLILQKYIGKDIKITLGSFYVDISSPVLFSVLLACDNVSIIDFDGKIIYNLELIEDNIENLDKFYNILKPFIADFLSSLDKESFHNIRNTLLFLIHDSHTNFYQNKNQIDLDKIEKLRKDREFGK
ncbi:hypothetical protein H2279_08245 [Campylobacter sp. B0100352/1]|uniref:hypothetical protein n=1 Tax=unclassified Campylobacter TaxID=2593542 RepID=UPI001DD8B30A|nr:hypothetical protein [Campylobacter sp. B0100352/1]MBZ7965002.1 hypothetical protein [Campylobacter sp. 2457A]